MAGWAVALTGTPEPTQLRAEKTTANIFETLGARPLLGRTFAGSEDLPGVDRVAVLSHAFWQDRFGGDRAVLGRTILLDGDSYDVVGVMPPGFQIFGAGVDLWIPLPIDPSGWWYRSNVSQLIARLAAGAPITHAQEEFGSLVDGLRAEFAYPDDYGQTANIVPVTSAILGDSEPAMVVFAGAAALVLVVAVGNVGTLLVARTVERTREMAVRTALGAGRRLVWHLFVESTALAIVGGLVGIAVAWWTVQALVTVLPAETPRLGQIAMDMRVFSISFLLLVVVSLVVAGIPAAVVWRGDVQALLRGSGVDRAVGRGGAMRNVLVIGEVAIALMLLAGAGLMLQTMIRLGRVDLGFRPDGVLTLRVQPVADPQGAAVRHRAYYASVFEQIEALPGIVSVGAAQHLPLSGFEWGANLRIEGQPLAAGATPPRVGWRLVAHDYFAAVGVPVLHGRLFSDTDGPDAPPVVIVNEQTARRFWGSPEAALSRRVSAGAATNNDWATVVGVVGNVRHTAVSRAPALELYRPYQQQSSMAALMLVVRTEEDPLALAAVVRQAVWSVDPTVPVSHIAAMSDVVSDSVARPKAVAVLLIAFALIAVIVSLVGVYGVVTYRVSCRTREIGLRLALGAGRGTVLRMVVRQGLALALVGIAIGVAGALALTRLMASLLYEVQPNDPETFAVVTGLLAATALAASCAPALRAARLNPVIALRSE